MGMDEREGQPVDDLAAMGAPASPDALKEIVARHQRTRTRTLGVLLAVALVAGPLAGWAIGNSGGGGQQLATGSQPNAPAAGQAAPDIAGGGVTGSASAIASPDQNPPKTTHLFTRTTGDGIVVRAYRTDPPPPPPTDSSSTSTTAPAPKTPEGPCTMPGRPGVARATANANSGSSASASASSGSSESGQVVAPPPGPDGAPGPVISGTAPPCPGAPPICKATPSVLAELSTDAAVGQGFDPIDETQPSDALSHVSLGMLGVPEGSPVVFVAVQTGPGVATARLRLPDGSTDQMAPVNGIAVLAHTTSTPKPTGTVVEALDSSGKVLASNDVGQPGTGPRTAFACGMAVGPNTVKALPAPAPAAPPTTR